MNGKIILAVVTAFLIGVGVGAASTLNHTELANGGGVKILLVSVTPFLALLMFWTVPVLLMFWAVWRVFRFSNRSR